ncbi:MAG TPA: sensor histidine kinase, partial [Rhodanobacter sp.]
QWVKGGIQRVAQYTNLSPGHYTFHVNASADTGRWGAQESTLDFVVIPHFYQTWWFRLLGALAVILILLGIYRLRVNWLHARAAVLEERHRMAGEIHDSLAQGFSGIIFQTEAALLRMKRTHSTTVGYVESARDLARSSLKEARSSIWNLSPPAVDQKSLLESVSLMARQLTGGRVDELDIHSSGTAWLMQAEAQHHMVLIVQEAVSNAIQHGSPSRISIKLSYKPDSLLVQVVDDGIGIHSNTAEQPGRGFGLKNMRHRSECLGARLKVMSKVGRGTTVSLYVPRLGTMARLWRHLRGNSTTRIDG